LEIIRGDPKGEAYVFLGKGAIEGTSSPPHDRHDTYSIVRGRGEERANTKGGMSYSGWKMVTEEQALTRRL